ncbi:MAG: acriflavin resistance protein, partial [Ignavibacteria bacterium]|nr:acriflavin resistance protein [Ignavibacteria bacterium]
TIPGVSQIQIWGEKKYSMSLWLDPVKMSAYKVTPVDIKKALSEENIELPSGKIEGAKTELTIRTHGRINLPEEFNNLIVRQSGNTLIRFKDVGYASYGPENENTIMKRDGVPAVGVALMPQSGANHIEISKEFHSRLAQLRKELPKDVKLEIGFDNTKFIRNSILEVEETILIAFGLVILIIFIFLRSWRSTLIPILAIPISLIGSFFIMYAAGFSINVLTLLGIVLAIGLVVDDAIVVLENIFRKIESGMPPKAAAIDGSREIFFAIISTTLTLAAVFLPIVFLQGLTGRLFREFGIVIAGSVIISAFVALTLTPMLSSKIIHSHEKHSRFYNLTEPFFVRLIEMYRNSLNAFMKRRYIAFIIMMVSLALIALIFPLLPTELSPIEDRSYLRISATGPEGASFDFMNDYMDKLLTIVDDHVPESQGVISGVALGPGGGNVNTGFVRLMLKDREERNRKQQEIAEKLSDLVLKQNDARAFVVQEQTIGTQRGGLPIQYVLLAPTLDKLRESIPRFLEESRKDATFKLVDVNLKFTKPELVIDIDRLKTRELGISVSDIAQTLQLAFSGQRYGFFIKNEKQYQVIGQLKRSDRSKPLDLKSLYLRSKSGDFVQLSDLVSISSKSNPPQLFRYNRFVAATVSASLAPGKTIGDGIEAMDKIKNKVLDDSFSTALQGASKDFMESSSSLLFTFLLAIILIYLILAAQFESFRDPFVIMFTVPLAFTGALLSIWYFRQTMNIFSEIGLIMLIGLVTKNGILIVEFANQKREQGLPLLEAVKEAAVLRFRPILMTSLSTILGALPIALALGAGSESRVSMGIAVIGGLIFSTLLTLYVIPAVYSYFSRKTL